MDNGSSSRKNRCTAVVSGQDGRSHCWSANVRRNGSHGGSVDRSGGNGRLSAGLGRDFRLANINATRDSVVVTVVDAEEGIATLGIITGDGDENGVVLIN